MMASSKNKGLAYVMIGILFACLLSIILFSFNRQSQISLLQENKIDSVRLLQNLNDKLEQVDKFWEILNKQVYNIQNQNKILGRSNDFAIKINESQFKDQGLKKRLKKADIWNKIQVGSKYDYANLTNTINFKQLKQKLLAQVSYQVIRFPEDKQHSRKPQKMELLERISKQAMKKRQDQIFKTKKNMIHYQTTLANSLLVKPNDPKIRQEEYTYYNSKYNIGANKKQLSICIFSSGHKIFTKNLHVQLFQSFQKLNYTNFHIVYVDDFSPYEQIKKSLYYIQTNNFTFKNKITVIHTLQHLGKLANEFFFINKYCQATDIIVEIDADDIFIGTQVLQILNSIYKNEDIWFAYSKHLKSSQRNIISVGASKQMEIITSQYRSHFNHWSVSALRTFRKQIFSKLPIESVIEYHLDQSTNLAYPSFYKSAADTFSIFSLVQMCGDFHSKHITSFLYFYSGPQSLVDPKKCYREHERIDQMKSRIKYSLKKLQSLSDTVKYDLEYQEHIDNLEQLQNRQQMLSTCLNI